MLHECVLSELIQEKLVASVINLKLNGQIDDDGVVEDDEKEEEGKLSFYDGDNDERRRR